MIVLTYKTAELERLDKASLEQLLGALDGVASALRRDDCGAWQLKGRFGQIYTMGSAAGGWLLVVMNEGGTSRQWTADKLRLGFCKVTQNGDTEGCLRLDRLPNAWEAKAIRTVLGIRERRHYSEEVKAAMVARGRALARPLQNGGLAPSDRQVEVAEGDDASEPSGAQ